MRGTLAKRIRQEVYGDSSQKGKRRYAVERTKDEHGVNRDTVINTGLCAAYQQLKQVVKSKRRKGERI